jgi:hypothetical protein
MIRLVCTLSFVLLACGGGASSPGHASLTGRGLEPATTAASNPFFLSVDSASDTGWTVHLSVTRPTDCKLVADSEVASLSVVGGSTNDDVPTGVDIPLSGDLNPVIPPDGGPSASLTATIDGTFTIATDGHVNLSSGGGTTIGGQLSATFPLGDGGTALVSGSFDAPTCD